MILEGGFVCGLVMTSDNESTGLKASQWNWPYVSAEVAAAAVVVRLQDHSFAEYIPFDTIIIYNLPHTKNI